MKRHRNRAWRRLAPGLGLATLVLAAAAAAAARAAPSSSDPGLAAITDATLRGHVAVLASDAFRGRFPATAGEDSTLAYLERRFRSLGLKPAIEGSYRQEVPLVRRTVRGTPTVRLTRTAGAPGGGELPWIRWGDDLLLSSTLLDTALAVRGAEIVFAGYGISTPEIGWDDYAGLDCRGKVVFVLAGDPGRTPADSTLFGGRALTHYGLTATKQEMAAAHGALGLLVMHDPDVVGYPFDILTAAAGRARYDLAPEPGTSPGSLPRTAFAATVRREVGVALLRAAGLDPARATDAAGRRGFHGRPLGIAIDVAATLTVEHARSYNLLGVVRGSTRPGEVVAYSAHWDHMGVGVPVAGDSIYNGAVDNATGTAALLTLAKAYRDSGRPPARSVLFWATTCEEQGLLGSYWYADHPVFPLAKTVALINMDALFPFGADDQMVVTGFGQSELEDLLVRAAASEGRTVAGDDAPETGAFYRSDHYPLAKKGVPAIFAIGESKADTTQKRRLLRYVASGYHKPQDELTPDWDLAGILQDVRCYYRLGRMLADGFAWPNWRTPSEFRAARDAMRR
jgi:Zn-dependent M28 family amino/carboxypeptidase